MNAPAQIDQYSFWRERLTGKVIPIHDSEPQAGFYRNHGDAVAYWFGKDGNVRCRVNDQPIDEQRMMELWPFASKKPVTHEAYEARIKSGQWPSESEVVSQDLKAATEADANTLEGLQGRIAKLVAEAEAKIKVGAAADKDAADVAADIADRLTKLRGSADKAREAEKRPHWDKCVAIEAKWKPLLTTAEIYKRLRAVVVEPYLRKAKQDKEKAEQEARDKAAAAKRVADEVAAKVAEAAAQANAPTELMQQEAEAAAAAAAAAAADAQRVASQRVTAGTRGRTTHLRTTTVVTIEDRAKLLDHFKDRDEITAVLQTLAERAVTAGETPPGVKVSKEGAAT